MIVRIVCALLMTILAIGCDTPTSPTSIADAAPAETGGGSVSDTASSAESTPGVDGDLVAVDDSRDYARQNVRPEGKDEWILVDRVTKTFEIYRAGSNTPSQVTRNVRVYWCRQSDGHLYPAAYYRRGGPALWLVVRHITIFG